jgi:hypothetical protein
MERDSTASEISESRASVKVETPFSKEHANGVRSGEVLLRPSDRVSEGRWPHGTHSREVGR